MKTLREMADSLVIFVVVTTEAHKVWNRDYCVFTDRSKAMTFAHQEVASGKWELRDSYLEIIRAIKC